MIIINVHEFYRDIISVIESVYNMKTGAAEVQYPKAFAQKIRKIFNNNDLLFAKALKQVSDDYACF